MAVQSIHWTPINGDVFDELSSQNDFNAVLATFRCLATISYGAKASEAVQKIATNQKEYHVLQFTE